MVISLDTPWHLENNGLGCARVDLLEKTDMILVEARGYHTNGNNNVLDTMNDSTMMINLQQQRFHDSAMAEQPHGPIRVGNYAVQQPRKGFKGDSDEHVDELISACAQHNNSVKENHTIQEIGGLQMMKNERTLVPYFGGSEDNFSMGGALEWPVKGDQRKSGNNKSVVSRKNGKKKAQGDQKKAEKHQGNGNPHKQQRQDFHENKHGHQQAHQRQYSKPQKSGKYAGPAFTVSPVPENLPMPSKLFLS